MNRTKIEWTDFTWNVVTGCTKVSPGCANCYAARIAHRFAGTKAFPEGFRVTLHPDRLDLPLRWRKPRRVFVDSMGDLFHPDVPDEFIDQVFATMALAKRHTFQALTKRPQRMLAYPNGMPFFEEPESAIVDRFVDLPRLDVTADSWPLPNVWLGVSVEDQARADERIPLLLQTPAAVRFVSLEPLLSAVDLSRWLPIAPRGDRWERVKCEAAYGETRPRIDWLVLGAETGPGARPCDPAWVQSIIEQARAAGVPVFVKDNIRWPERIQEYPQIGGGSSC